MGKRVHSRSPALVALQESRLDAYLRAIGKGEEGEMLTRATHSFTLTRTVLAASHGLPQWRQHPSAAAAWLILSAWWICCDVHSGTGEVAA